MTAFKEFLDKENKERPLLLCPDGRIEFEDIGEVVKDYPRAIRIKALGEFAWENWKIDFIRVSTQHGDFLKQAIEEIKKINNLLETGYDCFDRLSIPYDEEGRLLIIEFKSLYWEIAIACLGESEVRKRLEELK